MSNEPSPLPDDRRPPASVASPQSVASPPETIPLEAFPDAVVVVDGGGVALAANGAFAALVGVGPERVRGRVLLEGATGLLGSVVGSGERLRDRDAVLRGPSDERLPVRISASRLPGDLALLVVRDARDPRDPAALEALREREHRVAQILDAVPDMLVVKARGSKITWANRAACEHFGRSVDELRSLTDVPDDAVDFGQKHVREDDEVFRTGRRVEDPATPSRRRDGEPRILHTIKTPIVDLRGEIVELVAVCRDVTDRLSHERTLSDQERRLRLALDAGRMGAWEFDIVRNHVTWSPTLEEIHGIPVGSFDGTFEAYQRDIHPDDKGWVLATIQRNLGELREHRLTYRIVRPDGEVRWLDACGRFLAGRDGRPEKLIGICRDVTDEKLAEETARKLLHEQVARAEAERVSRRLEDLLEERRRAEEELEAHARELARSNAELEQFAYVASHDLQEPLRAVAGFTQLLARRYRGRLDEDADAFIGYAVEGVARMQRLIQDLLTYSRVGRKDSVLEPVDLERVLSRAVRDLEPAIAEASAQVTHDPLPTVEGDEGQLGQLVTNLVANGLKFRREEPPRIHVSAERSDDAWVVSIRDNGLGIERGYFDRIFVIFQRLHGRDDYPGTGIGLSICKKIVERHGGRIWVESTVGEGSVFRFTIPVHHERRGPEAAERTPT